MTSATGKNRPKRSCLFAVRSGSPAFTLVELLMVVAIMAIVMGSLGIAISNMGGPAPQVAAGQVASGLSLARQYAVAKNLETRFIICNLQGATGPGLPPEKLPGGVVFLNLVQSGYNTINDPGILGASVGKPHKPTFSATPGIDGSEWKVFESFTNYSQINVGSSTFKLGDTPSIGYRGVGEAVLASGKSVGSANQAMAIRVALGVVTPNNEIILKATNNYFYVETDKRGRVRVRSKESYRLP
jgi:prepilin-type N-terminal cleavage/methylation domain-containing protein